MANYRLYRLDGAGRITDAAELIEAESDDQAIARARAVSGDAAGELWQGRRFVGKLGTSNPRRTD